MTGVPSQIGPYTIDRELGRGGMGVVYLGHDARLDRPVAIKALPIHLAGDPERLARFEREARTLAQLSHPNIAGIYGVEVQDDTRYLVLEYVDGEPLDARVDRGPLPIDEAIELAVQIAIGVEAAHEAGVVHRDLKPANIIVTPDGKAKVLDFGLARNEESVSSTGGLDSPTITTPPPQHSPTIAGAILGTAPYMSPEQARGRRVDKRTDIWSFGVVLYELLAGANPFVGETASDSIGAVLHKAFDLDHLPAHVPPPVRHVLRRCLERDKSRRLQCIADARIELEDALHRLDDDHAGDDDSTSTGRASRLWPIVAACCAVVAVGSILALLTAEGFGPFATNRSMPIGPDSAAEGLRVPTVLGVDQLTDLPYRHGNVTLSPDGSTIAYTGDPRGGGDWDLFRLRVGGSTPINLTDGTKADEAQLAFSPDGGSIAYISYDVDGFARSGIFIMGATGENPRRVVAAPAFEPAWSPDGRSLAYTTAYWEDPLARGDPGALWVVDLETRARQNLDTTDPAADPEDQYVADAVSPEWSPDGTRIAYWALRNGTRDIFTVSRDGGDVTRITDDAHTDWSPCWSPDGSAIWFLSDRGGQAGLWSVALDDAGHARDEPRPIMLGPGVVGEASRSADGSSVAVTVVDRRELIERIRFDPETETFVGAPELLYSSSMRISQPAISPDGGWIAFHSARPREDVVVMRIDGSDRRRLTQSEAKDRNATWAPDGQALYYTSNERGAYELWTIDRDTAQARVVSIPGMRASGGWSISPDGTRAAFHDQVSDSYQLARLGDDGSITDTEPALATFGDGRAWSPDGRWIAGVTRTAFGLSVLGVLDTETDRVIRLNTPNGDPWLWDWNVVWIDETRVMGRGGGTEHACIVDVVSGESRSLESTPDEPMILIDHRSDGWLYVQRIESSSSIWLTTLTTPE